MSFLYDPDVMGFLLFNGGLIALGLYAVIVDHLFAVWTPTDYYTKD